MSVFRALFPYCLGQPLVHPQVRHGFFGRVGGVGHGVLASLNTGFRIQEDPLITYYHRTLIAQSVGFSLSSLCLAEQVHGSTATVVSHPLSLGVSFMAADALITSTPGCLLGVFTADCAPILLSDAQHGVIAAIHGGWRGALGGIVPHAVQSMKSLGASSKTIRAVIGPCIHQASYGVDESFYNRFCAVDTSYARFFIQDTNAQYRFNLPLFLQEQLAVSGIHAVILPYDTCAMPNDFFSHRGSILRKEHVRGNQLSVIGLL